MSVPVLMASCQQAEEETKANDYCYISNVSLGTVKRLVHTTTAEGKDTTYYTTFSGNLFNMTINQRSQTIENEDSLLYGSRLDAMLLSVSYEGAILAYRKAGTEAEWQTYSTKDSMDLREPIELYTLANDGHSFRTYTLKVNVHQQDGDSLHLVRLDSDVSALTAMTDLQPVVLGGKLLVLGKTADGIRLARRSSLHPVGTWTARAVGTLPADAQVRTLKQRDGMLYLSTAQGALYSSVDAMNWQLQTEQTGLQLVASTPQYLYALVGGSIRRSTDGVTWEAESLDDAVSFLPEHSVRSLLLTQPNGIRRLLLIGYRYDETDQTAVVWSKSWGRTEKEEDAEWMFYTPSSDNTLQLPQLESLNLLAYDERCLAFGGESLPGKGKHSSMDILYFSNDYGITWCGDETIKLNSTDLQGVSGPLAGVVDDGDCLWVVANGKVWRGRLNRLGFARQ